MPRARNIKPAFFKNEVLVELSYEARLLFIGLWTLADREGRLENRPKRIKMEIFPADNLDVKALLDELGCGGFIKRYGQAPCKSGASLVQGNFLYIQVHNFSKHQNPHIKEAASIIPKMTEHESSTIQALLIPDSLSLNPDSPILNPESNPKVIQKKSPMDLYVKIKSFEEFWEKYGMKKDRKKCEAAYHRAIKSGTNHDEIIQGLDAYQKECIKDQIEKQFIKRPLTWLNGGCWADEYDRELTREEKLREIDDVINAKQNNSLQITGAR